MSLKRQIKNDVISSQNDQFYLREYREIAPCLKSFVLSYTAWAVFTYALGGNFLTFEF